MAVNPARRKESCLLLSVPSHLPALDGVDTMLELHYEVEEPLRKGLGTGRLTCETNQISGWYDCTFRYLPYPVIRPCFLFSTLWVDETGMVSSLTLLLALQRSEQDHPKPSIAAKLMCQLEAKRNLSERQPWILQFITTPRSVPAPVNAL